LAEKVMVEIWQKWEKPVGPPEALPRQGQSRIEPRDGIRPVSTAPPGESQYLTRTPDPPGRDGSGEMGGECEHWLRPPPRERFALVFGRAGPDQNVG
jgi:hypothetical protein